MVPIYDEDGNLIGYEDAGDVTSEDDSWFWNSIGIDPTTISYTETSPTNEEIETMKKKTRDQYSWSNVAKDWKENLFS